MSADIPHCESQLSVTRRQVVKIIAAGRRSWPLCTGDVEPFHLGRFLRKKMLLNLPCHAKLFLSLTDGSLCLQTFGDVTRIDHNPSNRFILQPILGCDFQDPATPVCRNVSPFKSEFIVRLVKRLAKLTLQPLSV